MREGLRRIRSEKEKTQQRAKQKRYRPGAKGTCAALVDFGQVQATSYIRSSALANKALVLNDTQSSSARVDRCPLLTRLQTQKMVSRKRGMCVTQQTAVFSGLY